MRSVSVTYVSLSLNEKVKIKFANFNGNLRFLYCFKTRTGSYCNN